jgi:hypothetical protein
MTGGSGIKWTSKDIIGDLKVMAEQYYLTVPDDDGDVWDDSFRGFAEHEVGSFIKYLEQVSASVMVAGGDE